METGLIIDWHTTDPHTFYLKHLKEHPVHYVSAQQGWNIYAYRQAREIMLHQDALIPEIKTGHTGLNQNTLKLTRQLARLNNFEQHKKSRQAAMQIYNQIQPVSVHDILSTLLKAGTTNNSIDWVNTIGKKLPALYILKSLNFGHDDCLYIINHLSALVKIMSVQKTAAEIILLNELTDTLFILVQKHFSNTDTTRHLTENDEWTELLISNLIGLLIQSYDAGRGLLTNTLIQLIRNHHPLPGNRIEDYFKQVITETLRFDPPVHLTKRIAGRDILIGNQVIKKGEMITIVLAAANLDPQIFESSSTYNPLRANNHEHLTFGAGHHQCLAKHLMTELTAETFKLLYHRIQMPEQAINYEPLLNVRLVKNLFITI